jgi:alpha-L-rhamnosidase
LGEDGTIYDPDMNSYNHYAYGAVCQWLFEGVAGVAPTAEAPGFDVVTLDPLILPALSPVAIWHDCRHGRIEAGWSLEGDLVTYKVSLPQSCAGRLSHNAAHKAVTVNGQAIDIPAAGLTVGSGVHEITFRV